jgi:hypothetical protein
VTEICVATDIVVVSARRRETHGSGRPRETAPRSVASILILPPDIVRPHGPIVAVATGASDPSLAVAGRIAALGRERLVVLAPSGTKVEGEVRALPVVAASDIVAALGDTRERLIVMTRDGSDGAGEAVALARGVPVLVIEPV